MKTPLKKRYGQHFLRDTGVITRIIDLIQPAPSDIVLEVGAGDGEISMRLAPKVLRLFAVEIDRDVLPALKKALESDRNVEIIGQDVLGIDLAALLTPHLSPGVRLRVVGNLPYNIGTAIIESLLSLPLPIHDLTFMLQLETAERIAAAAGSKEYGFFSVFCRHHCDVRIAFKVSPACFVPRPRVNSAMIVLRPKSRVKETTFEQSFLLIAKAAFAYRRKQLVNSLIRNEILAPIAQAILTEAGISGSRRAEEVSVAEFERLAGIYHRRTLAARF